MDRGNMGDSFGNENKCCLSTLIRVISTPEI